ncbi:MAG: HAMP domain-containing histidine kinase [Alphaproteobacteria bacterium]|nr:HAMP domain-containing histidine kinase [Alphaproteobacteria bacterium]
MIPAALTRETAAAVEPRTAVAPSDERAVQCELADMLYSSPWPVATNLLVTLAAVVLLSIAFNTPVFLGWGVSIVGICVIRIVLWRLYHGHRQDDDFDPQVWLRRFTYFAGATGCQWGSLAMAVGMYAHAPTDSFVPIIIAGLAGGIASGYTAHVPVVDAFVWPVVAPLIVVTFAAGDPGHIALGVLYLAFAFNLSLMARRSFSSLIALIRNKAEKEKLVSRLFEANRRAETALRAKSEFLANMSHELRTPLNAVIGFSEIISGEVLGPIGNEKYLEYARDLNASGRHLLELINDILDLTKITAERLDLADEVVDVGVLVESCFRMIARRATAQNLNLVRVVEPEVNCVRGDERRLRQILLNLLTNSVKFTPSGGSVAVRASIEHGRLVFEVRDTGVGISEADLPVVLEPFGQVDNAFNRSGGGTGLGLPLTKKLVEAHGGIFVIESVPNQGTLVRVILPANRVISRKPPTEAAA